MSYLGRYWPIWVIFGAQRCSAGWLGRTVSRPSRDHTSELAGVIACMKILEFLNVSEELFLPFVAIILPVGLIVLIIANWRADAKEEKKYWADQEAVRTEVRGEGGGEGSKVRRRVNVPLPPEE